MYFFIKTKDVQLPYKNLIVLHHGENNFPFCFDICIKFTLSTMNPTMKKSHLTYHVKQQLFERKKAITEKPWQNMLHNKTIPS